MGKYKPDSSNTDIRMKGFKEKKDVLDFWALIDDHLHASKESELVKLHEAAGRVLSATIISSVKVPSFNRSAMDGYAIRGEDSFGASTYSP